MSDSNIKAEVIIIGGGIAGIVCALELLDKGKKVILLDRDVKENFGGLAKESFGGMFFVNTPQQRRGGIKDSVDLATRDWYSFAEFDKNAELPKQWAEKYIQECTDKVYWYLRKKGVKFFPVVHWVERGLYQPGNSVPRFHMVWGTGQGLIEELLKNLENHPKRGHLSLFFTHCVNDFEISSGQVSAVLGINEENNTPFRFEGEVFVVASGGIGGNIEMVKSNWPTNMGHVPETILNGSHQFADGKIHDLVSANLQGTLSHMDKMWPYAAGVHHHRPKRPGHGLSLIPIRSALWLNYKGERFGPMPLMSSFDTSYLVQRICEEEKQYSWQVMNMKIAVKEMAISGSEFNHAIREKSFLKFLQTILFGNKDLVNELITENQDFITAGSINELADKMNTLTGTRDVDQNSLAEAINNYDSNIDRGKKYFNDEQLRRLAYLRQYRGDRARLCKFQKIADPKAMPFVAIREFILSRKSLGGLQTDLQSRILGNDGKPIPGLYGIGEAAGFGGGGIHGKRSLEGTFLGTCVLTARNAAESMGNS